MTTIRVNRQEPSGSHSVGDDVVAGFDVHAIPVAHQSSKISDTLQALGPGGIRRCSIQSGASAPYVLAKNSLEIEAGIVEPGKGLPWSPADELTVVGLDSAARGRQVHLVLRDGGPLRRGAAPIGKHTIVSQ